MGQLTLANAQLIISKSFFQISFLVWPLENERLEYKSNNKIDIFGNNISNTCGLQFFASASKLKRRKTKIQVDFVTFISFS
jgi:hypothetical protein